MGLTTPIAFLVLLSTMCMKIGDASIQLGSCSLSCEHNENEANENMSSTRNVGPPGKAGRPGHKGDQGLPGIQGAKGETGESCTCPDFTALTTRIETLEKELAFVKDNTMNGNWTKTSNGSWYRYFDTAMNYNDSKASCESFNARLASAGIRNPAVLGELRAGILSSVYRIWVGLDDIKQEGRFMWSDGVDDSTIEHTLWRAGEPNNYNGYEDCSLFYVFQSMNDMRCSFSSPYLCEKV